MAAELQLHASKADYENLITQLDGKLQELNDLLADYDTQKTKVNNFVQDRDYNFERMQNVVEANIKGVRDAIKFTQESREHLQKTVDQMESTGENIAHMLDEAGELAGNVIKTAFRVDGLGL